MEPSVNGRPSWRLAVMLAALVATSPFAIDTYLPALPAMAEDYATSIDRIQISISLYLLGFAFGQIIGGPISDSIGRKPVAITGLVIYLIACAATIFSNSVEQLLVLRFIQAVGGGGATVITAAIVRDLYSGKDTVRMLSLISIIMMAAPLIAPGVGTLMLIFSGWRSIFVLLLAYASMVLLMLIMYMPETRLKESRVKASGVTGILRSYGKVFNHRRAMGYILSVAFCFANLFTFLTASSFVYLEFFEIPTRIYPVLFGINVLALMVVNRINVYFLNFYEPEQLLRIGLGLQLVGSIGLFISCTVIQPDLFSVCLFILISICSLGLITANAVSCCLVYFPDYSGTANAVIGMLNASFGAMGGLLLSSMHDGTLIPLAVIMLGATLMSVLSYALAIRAELPDSTLVVERELK